MWYFLCSFVTFFAVLVSCTKKNPATLLSAVLFQFNAQYVNQNAWWMIPSQFFSKSVFVPIHCFCCSHEKSILRRDPNFGKKIDNNQFQLRRFNRIFSHHKLQNQGTEMLLEQLLSSWKFPHPVFMYLIAFVHFISFKSLLNVVKVQTLHSKLERKYFLY
jgi:hypothetical protein